MTDEANVTAPRKPCLYVFLDEAGNFDFSPNGTKYIVFTSVSGTRPLRLCTPLMDLKFDLVEEGHELGYFHASEDAQSVRDRVFAVITAELQSLRIDSLVVEKVKTGPALQPLQVLYPRMLGYLLRYVLAEHDLVRFGKVIVFTDAVPVARQRQAVEKATKVQLAQMLPTGATYTVLHHASQSNPYLQVVDYINWAIYRKWTTGDTRSYALVSSAIRREFDIFKGGTHHYY